MRNFKTLNGKALRINAEKNLQKLKTDEPYQLCG